MPILEKFCNAFKDAIKEYEAEMNGKIPVRRQPTLVELRALLDDFQREECSRIVLLKNTETIPPEPAFDKFTIYLIQDNETIKAHWYGHGSTESVIIRDQEKCVKIKGAFEKNVIEKSDGFQLFNDVISLCDYTSRQMDSLSARDKMMGYLQRMQVSPLASFISRFDSRLRIKLKSVLDTSCFSECELSAAERREIKARQEVNEIKTKSLMNQVSELAEALKIEQAKDNVQKVNALLIELGREKKNTAFLSQENTALQKSVNELFGECNTLKTENKKLAQEKIALQVDYHDLKVKYEALLQEKQSQEEPKQNAKKGFFG
jgi:Holliday junction resolvase